MTAAEVQKWLASGDLPATIQAALVNFEAFNSDERFSALVTASVCLAERCNRLQTAVAWLVAATGNERLAAKVAALLDSGDGA